MGADAAGPLGPIALSLSGGGGRAAGFHLGTLAYLSRLDLLKDVSILSTVSGASFIGASYALALKLAPAGQPLQHTFAGYYREFYETLLKSTLLPWALEALARERVKVPSGRRNLITALAQIYDETFLKQQRFGLFWQGPDIHLRDIILNATEFHGGLAFRFRKSDRPTTSGSERIAVAEEHVRHLRLADIVAASSCIPVGCEPLFFPDDFKPPEGRPEIWDEIKTGLREDAGVDCVPIMDGGVYDNQGMESVLIALQERREQRRLRSDGLLTARHVSRWVHGMLDAYRDLGAFIISDTPLACENLYPVSEAEPHGRFTLAMAEIAAWSLIVCAFATILSLAGHLFVDPGTLPDALNDKDDFLAYGFAMVLAFGLLVVLAALLRLGRRFLDKVPTIHRSSWRYVKRFTIRQVMYMIGLRLSSVWALTGSVYFNRIRQLGYSVVEARPDLRNIIICHEIYDLLTQDAAATLPDWLEPTATMKDVARRGAHLETKLWFDNARELDDVIACGQMTMCYNLLAHVELHDLAGQPGAAALEDTIAQARADWERFKLDPHALVRDPMAALPMSAARV